MSVFAWRVLPVLAVLAVVAFGAPDPPEGDEDREAEPAELDDIMEAMGKRVKSTMALHKERRYPEAVAEFERAARLAAQLVRFEPPIHKERVETWQLWAKEYPKEAERFLATLRKAAAGEARPADVTNAQGRLLKHCKRCHDEFQPEDEDDDDDDDDED